MSIGMSGDSYQFGLILDSHNRPVHIHFNKDYTHRPSNLTHKKGTTLTQRATPTRGYLDFFVANTWVIRDNSKGFLPIIDLVVQDINDTDIHLVYGSEPTNDLKLEYYREKDDCFVGMPGTNYRAYYPHSEYGELIREMYRCQRNMS